MLEFNAGDWEGFDGLGEEALEELRGPAEIGVEDALRHLVEQVKQTLGPESGPRTGNVYKRSKSGPPHIASAPGEAPAPDSGTLMRSIDYEKPEWNGWEIAGEIGTALEYARILEMGGIAGNGARILPRPYFEPTLLREEGAVEEILEASLRSAGG